LLQRIALIQLVPDADVAAEEAAGEMIRLAQSLAPEDTQLYYQIALQGRRDMDWAPDPRSGLEMTLLRMLAFRPGEDRPKNPAPDAPRRAVAPASRPSAGIATAPAPVAASGNWESVLSQLELRGPVTELARNCAWLGREGDLVQLRLDPRHQSLLVSGLDRKLEEALQRIWGAGIQLKISVTGGEQETPAQMDERKRSTLHNRAEQAIAEDPVVKDLQSRFGARVRPGSVEPLE
ncbi:MAG: DNA polymerase III subunit gamma/tau C-terminal domain-containing protein, partial [Nevskiales bacterium]